MLCAVVVFSSPWRAVMLHGLFAILLASDQKLQFPGGELPLKPQYISKLLSNRASIVSRAFFGHPLSVFCVKLKILYTSAPLAKYLFH
jgi:hypothetical protein